MRRTSGSLIRLFTLILLLGMVPSIATAQGNSEAAHTCQGDGFRHLVGRDGETFTNVGECVSFVARGGMFRPPLTIVFTAVADTDEDGGITVTLQGSGITPNGDIYWAVDFGSNSHHNTTKADELGKFGPVTTTPRPCRLISETEPVTAKVMDATTGTTATISVSVSCLPPA